MGYVIKIGEGIITKRRIDPENQPAVIKIKGAPGFGEVTDHENRLYPSYKSWQNCMELAKLTELFFAPFNGLMRLNYANIKINHNHLIAIESAILKLNKRFPDALQNLLTYIPPSHIGDTLLDTHGRNCDICLARLMWLEYWFDWALTNCKNPVIYHFQ